ncbi:MAG: hypothetical protein EXR99_05890 [Gemmataceae bacterium]|nr:hypothetical protein [Gemmataceae bacterium]
MFSARTDAHFEKAKRDIHEAAASTAEALSSVRTDYVKEFSNRLAESDKKYREVQEAGRNATGQAKARVMERLQQLDEQKADIRQRMDEYRNANDKAAENLRVGLDAAMSEYTKALLTPPLP